MKDLGIDLYIFIQKKSLQYFDGLLLSEFTHILEFYNYFFINYFNNYFNKIDKYGIEKAYINLERIIKVVQKYFKCEEIEGVELENWEEKVKPVLISKQGFYRENI